MKNLSFLELKKSRNPF